MSNIAPKQYPSNELDAEGEHTINGHADIVMPGTPGLITPKQMEAAPMAQIASDTLAPCQDGKSGYMIKNGK